MNLLRLSELSSSDVHAIWSLVGAPAKQMQGTVAWSFEGFGIRTRTTFIQAFRELGLEFIELPSFLKTGERACDLAGYLDPFYELYVIRESNHARLAEFAASSRRPIINAMSSEGHPCEVLTDGYYVETQIRPLREARVCLWGPPTNVLRSWHELAKVLSFTVIHVCDARFHELGTHVLYMESAPTDIDVVITDSWPSGTEGSALSLSQEHLVEMGHPKLLPTPPFSIGRELAFDPLTYSGFTGYKQKELLLPVQRAIIDYVTTG